MWQPGKWVKKHASDQMGFGSWLRSSALFNKGNSSLEELGSKQSNDNKSKMKQPWMCQEEEGTSSSHIFPFVSMDLFNVCKTFRNLGFQIPGKCSNNTKAKYKRKVKEGRCCSVVKLSFFSFPKYRAWRQAEASCQGKSCLLDHLLPITERSAPIPGQESSSNESFKNMLSGFVAFLLFWLQQTVSII